MVEPLSPRTLLSEKLLSETDPKVAHLLIEQLEAGLASAVWSRDRISFLKKTDPNAAAVAEDCFLSGVFRTSETQLRKIAQQGLVALFDAGEITSIEVGALADDIASLLKLAECFLDESGTNNLARVWDHVFDLPDGSPPIEIDFPVFCSQALTEW